MSGEHDDAPLGDDAELAILQRHLVRASPKSTGCSGVTPSTRPSTVTSAHGVTATFNVPRPRATTRIAASPGFKSTSSVRGYA